MATTKIEVFDSIRSFVNAIETRPLNKAFEGCSLSSEREDDGYWSGAKTFAEANELLLNGDKDNLAKVTKMDVKGTKTAHASRLRIERNVYGSMPNVPAYIIGVPNNMLNFRREPRPSNIVNIVYNITVSSDKKGDDMATAGAKIASIIKGIERNNIRVNLWVGFASKDRGTNNVSGAFVCIKQAAAPLNMLNIIYPIVHPSMLRRHFFKYLEKSPIKLSDSFPCSYGSPNDIKDIENDIPERVKRSMTALDLSSILSSSVDEIVDRITKK